MKYWAEVDGEVVNNTKGVAGWEPSKKAIVMRWFNSWGGSGELTYTKDGEKWVAEWRAADPDGAVSTWTDTIACKPDGNHHRVTDRIIGGKSMDDMDTVWKRR